MLSRRFCVSAFLRLLRTPGIRTCQVRLRRALLDACRRAVVEPRRLVFLMTSLGAGLFISTVSRTQQQAMMSTFLFFQPFFLLSGFTFPIRNMPLVVQYLTLINPVRYFLEIVRGIFLKGSGIGVLWPQLVGLVIIGVSVLTMSALRFHKKLD